MVKANHTSAEENNSPSSLRRLPTKNSRFKPFWRWYKKKVKWFSRATSKLEQERARERLANYHRRQRQHLVYITASPDLWYVKRQMAGAAYLRRYSMTLIMAAMHRLSELSRYDPEGLRKYLDGKENWLLTEFIELAPMQFIDELVCEMTSLEFGTPGIRPRST